MPSPEAAPQGASATRHWFEPLADHLGAAYLRYSFTKGTEQEVAFLAEALGLRAGDRVLDVGCGPGRHAHLLARRGLRVVGVDRSWRFVELAASTDSGARVMRADARALPVRAVFDVVLSLCQGGFGLLGGPDDTADPVVGTGDASALAAMASALRPGGVLVLSAFSSYFLVRHLDNLPESSFDAGTGVHHEPMTIKDENGRETTAEGWTTCFTPRELRLLAERAGLDPEAVWSVTPGDYAARAPDCEHAEYLMVARRPGGSLRYR